VIVTFPWSVGGSFPACVGELDTGDGAPFTDFVHDPFECGGLGIIPQASISPADASFGGDGGGFDDH
jgi:hypothetical protein